MDTRTVTPDLTRAPAVPVQAQLAAAWTSFMFLYVYVDVFNFYKPGVVDGILDGLVWTFSVSPVLLTVMLASVTLPAVMVLMSMVLPVRANRVVNIVVAVLLIPYSLFNAAGVSGEWVLFYVFSIGVELLLLAFVLWRAWTWRRA